MGGRNRGYYSTSPFFILKSSLTIKGVIQNEERGKFSMKFWKTETSINFCKVDYKPIIK